ncbi:LamG domain-containing protein [Vibrio harveyi]|uniref:LamG domain-containing protein n=5 Tax=Vibrio harveyi TaxID=669 RepID=UPI0023805E18|nr:LamG-like jellyroll fold domain-containing protein [Vibrio harveyi]
MARNKYGQKFISNIKKLVPLDTDEDQLPDHVELSICSDPNNADSDEDGLLDGIEVGAETGRHLSDPCSSDTDNDGIDDHWEYEFGSDPLTSDVGNLHSNGTSYWQAYIAAQSEAAEKAGTTIESGDHVLNVEGVKGFVRTGIFPEGGRPMTLMFWTRLKGLTEDNQLLGIHDATHDKRFYVGIDKENDAMFGVGNNYTDKYKSGLEFGEWTHIALVYDPANDKTRMYRNGEQVVSYDSLQLKGRTSQSLLLGARINGQEIDSYMDGQLDDVQVWTRALTEQEVQTYMLSAPQRGETNLVALYNFSRVRGDWVENAATGEFDAQLSSAQLLQAAERQVDTDGDGLTDRQELALCTDINNADSDGDGLLDGIEVGAETGRYLSDPCSSDTDNDGIDDHWEYEFGSDPLTSDVGNLHSNGTSYWQAYITAQSEAAEKAGTTIESGDHVLNVEGVKGFVRTGIFPEGGHPMTLMFWTRLKGLTEDNQLLGIHDATHDKRFYVGIDKENDAMFGVGNNYTDKYKSGLEFGEWTHIALVYDPANDKTRMYRNGEQVVWHDSLQLKGRTSQSLLLGARINGQEIDSYMDGQLDDVQVWTRALTEQEVQTYMLSAPQRGETNLVALYNFSRVRGDWVENAATGEFDAQLSSAQLLQAAERQVDTDGDGLTDRQELALCTDINNADSDGDGLLDGIEVGAETGRYLSDPCSSDTDNDGIDDHWEYEFGSDPLTSDVGNLHSNGTSYWQAYITAQSEAAEKAGTTIESGDHVLNVEGVKGFVRTGIFPEGGHPMTLMFWTRLKGLTEDNQLLGIHDATHDKRFYVGIDKENDAMFGVGNNYTDKYKSGLEFGEWTHIALVYDPANDKTRMYRNGEQVVWHDSLQLKGRTSQSLLLGARINGQEIDSYMDGQLDDVQVWTRALTEQEVQTYMLSAPQRGETNLVALYNFSRVRGDWVENAATGEFDAQLSSAQLLQAAERQVDTDGDGLTDRQELALCTDINNADSDGDGLLDGIEVGSETGRHLSDPCSSDTDNDGIDDHWEYEFGSDPLTSDVGNLHSNGTSYWQAYIAAQSEAAEKAGTTIESGDHVLNVEGVKGFVRTGIFPEGGRPMTLMFWTRLKGLTEDNQLLGIHDATHDKRFYVGIDKENDAMFGVGNNYTDKYKSGLEFGEWTHIALVYDPANDKTRMYRNGEQVVSYDSLQLKGRTSQSLLLGARINGQEIDSYMDGQLDDVQVWTRALTEQEVQTYMLSAPQRGETNLVALYNFSRVRGDWVENAATGEFDAQLSSAQLLQAAERQVDTDGDGLTDRQELALCTDINNADSDGDGLLDGIEVGSEIGRYLSDPCSSDTDNDGIDDGFEYARGWNLQRFDVAEVNKQGVNHWEEYTKAQSRSAESRGEEINSGDHVLDVTDKEAFAFTGLVPTGKHSMTLMYWVKFKTMGNHYQFSGVHDGQDHRLYVGLDGSQPIAGLGDNLIKGKNDIKVDKWVHLAAVFDKEASQRVLFVNGQEVKRESSAIFKGSSWRSLLFGAAHRAKGASDFQDAQLDGIQVWSRALDSSDVQSYMLTPPQAGESDVLAYYDFSRYRGLWVENLATGEFDMKLSEDNTIKSGSH